MKKIGLLPRLIIGLVVGILLGMSGIEIIIRLLGTFNSIFGNFLGFVIPLIIVGFVRNFCLFCRHYHIPTTSLRRCSGND